MRCGFRSAMFVMYFLIALLTAQVALIAATVSTVVPSKAGPWDPTLNPTRDYGVHDNTAPVAIDGTSGISFTPGATITVAYVSGLVTNEPSATPVDANGDKVPTNTSNGVHGKFPAFYMSPAPVVGESELVGTFADDHGLIVGNPFAVGDGPVSLTVPAGASQLLLGINDNLYSDNGGSFSVTVTSGCQVSVSRRLTGSERSLTREPTEMNATFSAGPGLSLIDAASACNPEFVGFDWQQQLTTLPCPSPFRPNPTDVSVLNLCPDGSLKARPAINDPPPGGYTFPDKYLGYDPYPFYYYSATAQMEENGPTNLCIDDKVPCTPLVSADDTTLAFYDMPSNPCLPFGNPLAQAIFCSGMADPPLSLMAFTTALVGIKKDGTASPPLSEWTWIDTFNGISGGIPTTYNNRSADAGSGTGGITITSINGVPQMPPSVTCAASPSTLWPPDKKPVRVTVSGIITHGTSALVADGIGYAVIDEYEQVKPSGGIGLTAGGGYSFGVLLTAARNGSDLDGRKYTIVVTGTDTIGNVGSCSAVVIVPHDQGQ